MIGWQKQNLLVNGRPGFPRVSRFVRRDGRRYAMVWTRYVGLLLKDIGHRVAVRVIAFQSLFVVLDVTTAAVVRIRIARYVLQRPNLYSLSLMR